MGEAKRKGSREVRVALAEQELAQRRQARELQEHEERQEKRRQERALYDREVEEFGEDEAENRWEARKRERLQRQIQVAQLVGIMAGAFAPPPPKRREPASLQEFLNNPSAFLGDKQ